MPKKVGNWCLCGAYHILNLVPVPDRYPLLQLQDFMPDLYGTTTCNKIDLMKAYHQIPFTFVCIDDLLIASLSPEMQVHHLCHLSHAWLLMTLSSTYKNASSVQQQQGRKKSGATQIIGHTGQIGSTHQ